MIELVKNYRAIKSKGIGQVVSSGTKVIYRRTLFDQNTGDPVSVPREDVIDAAQLQKERNLLVEHIADIDEMLNDISSKLTVAASTIKDNPPVA